MTTPRTRSALLDFGLLLGRVVVGATFVMHGWQKFDQGIQTTVSMLTGFAIPYPQVAAWLLVALEVVGGALLILGALVRPLGLLFAAEMAGAIVFVHFSKGFFVADGGFELALLMGVVGLLFVCTGGGRFGIDGAVSRSRRARAEEKRQAMEPEPSRDTKVTDTRVDQFGRV